MERGWRPEGRGHKQQSRRPMSENRRLCLIAPNDTLRWKKQDRRGCRTEAGNGEKAPVGPEKYTPAAAIYSNSIGHTAKPPVC